MVVLAKKTWWWYGCRARILARSNEEGSGFTGNGPSLDKPQNPNKKITNPTGKILTNIDLESSTLHQHDIQKIGIKQIEERRHKFLSKTFSFFPQTNMHVYNILLKILHRLQFIFWLTLANRTEQNWTEKSGKREWAQHVPQVVYDYLHVAIPAIDVGNSASEHEQLCGYWEGRYGSKGKTEKYEKYMNKEDHNSSSASRELRWRGFVACEDL